MEIVLGIVYCAGKVLIGRRKEKDPHIEKLTWVFPGGKPKEKNDKIAVAREVEEETGLKIEVHRRILSRTYPENPDIKASYFYCKARANNAVPGGDLAELKWVKPMEVTKYFTTSIHPKILEFLMKLEEK